MDVFRNYDRGRALAYAKRWARGRNPLFYYFTGIGGDCTNFVSQCVLAGCCAENFTPDFGWYYRTPEDRAPAFTGVGYFWQFMTGDPVFRAENGGLGPFGREVTRREIQLADAVQLGDSEGDFYHTLLVTGIDGEELLLSSHSNDVYNRPLSAYHYGVVRFLHLDGARLALDLPDCFENLIRGVALPLEL